jgi:hypothetical protein
MATLLQKALPQIMQIGQSFSPGRSTKTPRGSLGSFIVGAPPEYGQPRPDAGGTSISTLITPERMREIVMRTPTASACLNAILDFASAVEIKIRNTDPSVPAPATTLSVLQDYMVRPNPQDSWLQFKLALFRDLVTMGWAAVEIEKDSDGGVANLYTLDAARLYIDFDEHGTIVGYDMLDVRGMPIHGPDGTHAWLPDEVIFYRLNPVTYSRYPASRIHQLYTLGLIEDMMMAFIGTRFTESNIPFGLLDLGDVSPKELDTAINYWNAQVKKNHRIVVTGSKGTGAKYYSFGYHLKDLEATNLLAAVRGQIMGIMGVTMNELGDSQDINKSNGYNLSYTFKKRAIEPLLNEFCATTTKRLVYERLGYRNVEMYYDEIDSRDELIQAQIDDTYLKSGVETINMVRNRKGLPSVKGGDVPMIETNTGAIPVSMVDQFAQAQLAGLMAAVAETYQAIQQSQQQAVDADGNPVGPAPAPLPKLIDLPLIRPPQPPDSGRTPLGGGRSSMKVKYPTASQLGGNKDNSPKQAPRGPVQAARSAGIRKEDSQS